jgi:hypothetical protein
MVWRPGYACTPTLGRRDNLTAQKVTTMKLTIFVFDSEDLLSLDRLAPALREHGIAAVNQPLTATGADTVPAPAGLNP